MRQEAGAGASAEGEGGAPLQEGAGSAGRCSGSRACEPAPRGSAARQAARSLCCLTVWASPSWRRNPRLTRDLLDPLLRVLESGFPHAGLECIQNGLLCVLYSLDCALR